MFKLNKKDKPESVGRGRGKIVTIKLSAELYSRLESISKKYGVSKSQIIKQGLLKELTELESS